MKKSPNLIIEELVNTMTQECLDDCFSMNITEEYELSIQELIVLDAIVSDKVMAAMKQTWFAGGERGNHRGNVRAKEINGVDW